MRQIFEGRLTLDHMSCHVPHHFDVPEDTGTLRLDFSFSPGHPGVGNIPHQLSISVYGPDGARGTRHHNVDQSPVISRSWASPGYLPGEIEAGEWVVEIDVHRILPPGNVAYRIEIACDAEECKVPPVDPMPDPPPAPKRRGAGWYTGDLHGHTFHSDGEFSPADYLETAHRRGYDFVALTDHNTVSALPHVRRLAGNGITVIDGVELTTFNGHALVLGLEGWIDWRIKDGTTMSDVARAAMDRGGLFVIAHPKSEGHPFCTGCRWAFSDMLPGPARHVEIWNGPWTERSQNEDAIQMYYHWLNAGYRMVATAGSDSHGPAPASHRIAANRVFADDNAPEAILAALRRGHSYVTSGPDLTLLAATANGGTAKMGDVVAQGPVRLTCGCQAGKAGDDLTNLSLRLIRQGKEVQRWHVGQGLKTAIDTEAAPGSWFALELRDRTEGLHGVTNPVFVGGEGKPWH